MRTTFSRVSVVHVALIGNSYHNFSSIAVLTDAEKCDLQDIIYIPKQPVGPGVTNKSPFRELVKIR